MQLRLLYHSSIGQYQLKLSSLPENKTLENWYTLQGEDENDDENNKVSYGEVRILLHVTSNPGSYYYCSNYNIISNKSS